MLKRPQCTVEDLLAPCVLTVKHVHNTAYVLACSKNYLFLVVHGNKLRITTSHIIYYPKCLVFQASYSITSIMHAYPPAL